MKILPVDLNEMEHCNFAGLEVDFLQLNGKELWNNLSEQVGLDLNYTALDANGYMDGEFDFDGTITQYAVGKASVKYLTQIVPTPTTKEGYYDKYIYVGTLLIDISSSNFSSYEIVVGETPCYEYTNERTEYSISSIKSVASCSGYNSEYYNGYDFSTAIAKSDVPYSEDNRIVPEILAIPDTYKGLPVTQILGNAFYCGSFSSGSLTTYTQASYIKDIIFGSNIETIGGSNFNGLINYGIIGGIKTKTDFYIPEGVKMVGVSCFNAIGINNSAFYKFVIPESLEVNDKYFTYTHCSLIICKAIQITPSSSLLNGYFDNGDMSGIYGYDIVFKKSVKQLTGTPFYNQIAKNLVFEHTDEDEIIININSPKSAKSTKIYTDSTYVRNYDWASKNITPTFYSLSEYTGELE